MKLRPTKPSFDLCAITIAIGFAGFIQSGFAAPAVNALPTGGNVVAGSAAINQAGNTMNINQSSQRAVIHWNSFDVGSQAKVNFNQPNAQAATLNYVNSSSKSMINGAVNANGQVTFVNNNGVVFGKNAEVNVGGLVATTMNVDANKFMAGDSTLTFTGSGSGKVINKGRITGNNPDSYIALMAPSVKNSGVITATMSEKNVIALAAGEKVSLTFAGSQLVSVSVEASVLNALISNKLMIQTNGGQVIIAANAAQDLMGSTIKNTGQISASGISKSGGKITLVADTITQAGTVSADSNTDNGGKVTIQGNTISLAEGSVTSATGAANGGLINVGTTKVSFTQNADGTRSNLKAENLANTVTVEQNATVDASSTRSGNGGEINIWSQVQTNVAGILKAMGGSQGGNGGFIETSSNGILNIAQNAIVNVTAALGKVGMWLLDPDEMTITSSTATAISNAASTANVTISVSGNLNVASGATLSSSSTSGTTLTLNASGSVTNNGTISMGQNGAVVINATSVNLASGSSTTANQITATAQAINVSGSVSSTGGSSGGVTMLANGIVLAGPVSANGSTGSSTGSSSGSSTSSSSSTTTSGMGTSGSSSSISSSTTSTSSTASSTTETSNNSNNKKSTNSASSTPVGVGGVAAAVTAAANAASTNIAASTSAAAAAAARTSVINLAPTTSAANLNGAIASAATAAASGTTTIINVAAGQVAGINQAAMSLTVAPTANISAQTSNAAATTTQLASGGQVNIVSTNTVTTTSASSVTADAAPVAGATGGQVNIQAYGATANLGGLVSASSAVGKAGTVTIAANDINATANIKANGTTGGAISLIAAGGNANLSNATVAATGSTDAGGYIQIAAQNTNQIINSKISANGITQGGTVLVGLNNPSNTSGSGSTLAPPATAPPVSTVLIGNSASTIISNSSITADSSSQNGQSTINSPIGNIVIFGDQIQVDNSSISTANGSIAIGREGYSQGGLANYTQVFNSSLSASKVETSGKSLAVNGNSVLASEWLLDPTNVTISSSASSSAGSTSSGTTTFNNISNVSTSDIQNAINAGTNVTVAADGSIAINSGTTLTFNVASANKTPTLTLDNRAGSKQAITLYLGTTITDNTSASGSGVNLNIYSAGGAIAFTNGVTNVNISLKGALDIDNTFAVGGTTSGFITAANAPTYAIATNSGGQVSGIAIGGSGAISAKSVRMYGVSAGTTAQSSGVSLIVNYSGTITATAGDITLNGVLSASSGIAQTVYGVGVAGNLTANAGKIVINGSINSTGAINNVADAGVLVQNGPTISAKQILITGSAITASSSPTYGVEFFNLSPTLNIVSSTDYANGGTALNITGNTTNGTYGVYLPLGTINNNANGGDVKFISDTSIYQGGSYALNLNANTSSAAQNVLFDTRSGGVSASITEGAITIATTGATNPVNYLVLTNGAPITIGGARTIPGYIKYDNTCLGCSVANFSGTIPSSSATSSLTPTNSTALLTTSVGITVSGAQEANTYIFIDGINNSASNASVSLGASTLKVNAGAGFDANNYAIRIIGLKNTANIGGNAGISSSGGITNNASGGNVLFQSNGTISQSGTLTIAANTSGTASNVTYDTTAGNKASTISTGTLSLTGTSSSSINYSMLTSGAQITAGAVSVPGSITLDNTYATTSASPSIPVSGGISIANGNLGTLATTGDYGIKVNGDLVAGTSVLVKGVDNSGQGSGGVQINANISSSQRVSGFGIDISGQNLLQNGVYVSAAKTLQSGTSLIAGGDINILAYDSSSNSSLYGGGANLTISTYGGDVNLGTSANPIYGGAGINNVLNTITSRKVAGAGGNVSIYATATGSGNNAINDASAINADGNITVVGSNTSSAPSASVVSLTGTITVNNTTNNATLSVTGNSATTSGYTGASTGVSVTGLININSNGGSAYFASNNSISQTNTINLAANTSGTTSNISYDTTTGNKSSTITSGTLSLTGGATGSSSSINYSMLTSGAAISTAAITISGSITLDNTYGGTSGPGGTPVSGFISRGNGNLSSLATTNITGINIGGA